MDANFLRLVICAILSCSLLGCKRGNELETATVTGKVSLDSKPLTYGNVGFVPSRGRGAWGDIQPDGTYKLHTYGTDDGAIIGSHKVTVTTLPRRTTIEEPTSSSSLTPDKYASPESSGLVFEVKKGAENVYNIELKSK